MIDYERIIGLLNLELIERKQKGFHFRCPICGDSRKSATARSNWPALSARMGVGVTVSLRLRTVTVVLVGMR
jgi:hypothetical protein